MQINEINTKKQFYKMRNQWNKTLNKSKENSIFLTWEEMEASVNQIKNGNSLKILCATEDNELVGIAPFRKIRRSLRGKFKYSIVEPLTNGNTNYTGIILAKQEKKCLQQLLDYLFKQKDWDLLFLPNLPQTSLTLKLLKDSSENVTAFDFEKGVICPYITIPDSKEKLLASLHSKFRKNLQRRLHKLEKEQGKIELKHFYEVGSLKQAMEIFFKLHEKRWKSKNKPGRFGKHEARNNMMQTAKFFAEKDWFRLYFLTVNNKPVAAELNLEYKGKMYGHLCGFDPDYSKYSVGNLLLLKILEKCVEKGISEYDFMQGDEAYKFDWTNKFRQNMNVKGVNKKLSSTMICLSLKVYKLINKCSKILKEW